MEILYTDKGTALKFDDQSADLLVGKTLSEIHRRSKMEVVVYSADIMMSMCLPRFLAIHSGLCGLKQKACVTFKNGDRTDFQISNLVVVTRKVMQNRFHAKHKASNNGTPPASKYRGVVRHHRGNRWEAKFQCRYIGTFGTEEEAASAYDAKALAVLGQDAYQNFPQSATSCASPAI